MRHAIVLAAVLLSGCASTSSASSRVESVEAQCVAQEPERLMDSWLAAHHAKDVDAITAHYEAEAEHATGRIFAGQSEIRAMFAESVTMADQFALKKRHFVMQGDYAFETGIANQRVDLGDGKYGLLRGDYVALLRRQDDGCWLIHHLVGGNAAMAPILAAE